MKIVLAERDAQLMQVQWEHGASTVAEVQAHLKDQLAYTTVLTMPQKLEKKGYVSHPMRKKGGRTASRQP